MKQIYANNSWTITSYLQLKRIGNDLRFFWVICVQTKSFQPNALLWL